MQTTSSARNQPIGSEPNSNIVVLLPAVSTAPYHHRNLCLHHLRACLPTPLPVHHRVLEVKDDEAWRQVNVNIAFALPCVSLVRLPRLNVLLTKGIPDAMHVMSSGAGAQIHSARIGAGVIVNGRWCLMLVLMDMLRRICSAGGPCASTQRIIW